ncbi:MAG TPA: hypothetical protein VG167_17450 [Verrucomicrobiae bacterium]|nr:hypothetical protein [Verrucomicrobiae bacterium]
MASAFTSAKTAARKADRIERFDELHGFLHQSMISAKHVARLELLTEQEDHQVAELASLILEMASVLPGKRHRWPTNAESRPGGLHELPIAAPVVPSRLVAWNGKTTWLTNELSPLWKQAQ